MVATAEGILPLVPPSKFILAQISAEMRMGRENHVDSGQQPTPEILPRKQLSGCPVTPDQAMPDGELSALKKNV